MKRLAVAALMLLLALAGPALAQSNSITGPLLAQNAFSELAYNGPSAQTAARLNLGFPSGSIGTLLLGSGCLTTDGTSLYSTGCGGGGGLPSIGGGYVLGNPTGSATTAYGTPISSLLDGAFGATQGGLLYRGASAWASLGVGTSGQCLQSGGASANPSWGSCGGGGGGNVSGPGSSVAAHVATFNNTGGTLLQDSGVALSSSGLTPPAGNFVFGLPSTSSLYVWKNSAGNPLFEVGGTLNALQTLSTLNLSTGGVWASGGLPGNSLIYFNQGSWTGATGTGNNAVAIFGQVAGEAINAAGQQVELMYLGLSSGGSTMQGARHVAEFDFNLSAASGNGSAGSFYTALNLKANGGVTDGGTGLTPGTAASVIMPFNPVASLSSGAQYYAQVMPAELDLLLPTGSSTMDAMGEQIVQLAGSVVQGARTHMAISINNAYAQGSGAGWKCAYCLGGGAGYFPMDPAGSVFSWQAHSGGETPTVANLFNFTGITVTGNSIAVPGYTVTGSGLVANSAASYAAAGTAIGTATPITTQIANVTSGTTGEGVQGPSVLPGIVVKITNSTGAVINVYPPSGATLNGGSTGAPVALVASGAGDLSCPTSTVCFLN